MANRLHVAFLRFVSSRYICIHWEQHGIRRMGTIRRSAESARGAFFLFFYERFAWRGWSSGLSFFSSPFFNIFRAASTLMPILILFLLYTYRYTRHILGAIYVGLRCMLWDFACFFFRSSFLYLIRGKPPWGGLMFVFYRCVCYYHGLAICVSFI